MTKNYNWGILGAGRIAEKFCTAINATDGATLYAVASRNETTGKDFAKRFNAPVYYNDYTLLMQDENVDVIYIATPHAFHYEQTIACLQHQKPVLCEKPMSLSYAQTKEMIDEAARQQVFFMEGMWTACMPFLNAIKEIIDAGTIGKLKRVSADFGFSAPKDLDGRLYNKLLGGGAMMDVGVYPLFLATILLGEPSVTKSISSLAETGIDEYTNTILQYPGGETAQLLSSIVFNTAIEAEISGTDGTIRIHNPWFKATGFTLKINGGKTEDYDFPHVSNGFDHEINEVMNCLGKGMLQSTKVPHSLSLLVSQITADILKQAGISYV